MIVGVLLTLVTAPWHPVTAAQYETRRFVPVSSPWRHTRQSGFRLPQGQGGQLGGQQPASLTRGVNQAASLTNNGGRFHGQFASQIQPPAASYQQTPASGDGSGGQPQPTQPSQPSYEENEVEDVTKDEGDIDLHNKEFCVDVSSYEPVRWQESQGEVCRPQWRMMCSPKSKQICEEVAETKCDLQPFTECQLGSETEQFQETKLVAKEFQEKECSQGRKEIPHTKMLPECRNVTKQNCVTLWETDEQGNKQWAGTDSCEPVTWQECQLVPKEVTFIVPEISCRDKAEPLWYHEPEEVPGVKEVTTFTCEPRSSVSCVTQTREVCREVTWEDCREVAVQDCAQEKVHTPSQEFLHRKKCLLPDEQSGAGGQTDSFDVGDEQPLPTYGG